MMCHTHFFRLLFLVSTYGLISACATSATEGTIGSLSDVKFEVEEEPVSASLEKAMESYEDFLKSTPETAMTPEALRRLADLKIQKDYKEDGVIEQDVEQAKNITISTKKSRQKTNIHRPDTSFKAIATSGEQIILNEDGTIANLDESEKSFSERAGQKIAIDNNKLVKIDLPGGAAQATGTTEAINLYKGLLKKYPDFKRNDQVLYQLSRAYEDIGQIDLAMQTLNVLVKKYPRSRHNAEAQFRRAEYFFMRKKYLDAEDAYKSVINEGDRTSFYELALYKQGWVFFKQELHEQAIKKYLEMLDYKISKGFKLDNIKSKIEKKRIDDTYRVISLSFSYLGGADAVVKYFDKYGRRFYEPSIYSHLGEHFLKKRRYSDAAKSYETYIGRNPLSKESPYFSIRVIEIYKKGGFPKLVVKAKKDFSKTYSLQSEYWKHFDIDDNPKVLGYLKSNLIDLANHYHALYQDKAFVKKKQESFKEAIYWYREFLSSFPKEKQAPNLNNQLAGLFLENKNYLEAATEYERTAYNYPLHEKSASAGYAAVFSYRENLKVTDKTKQNPVKQEIIRSSIKFQETFPTHKEAAVVLTAAVDDLYEMKDYERTLKYGRKIIEVYPNAEQKILRSAWTDIAHASFDTENYVEAENAYTNVLLHTNKEDKSYAAITENLAASVYKQGEQAKKVGNHKLAAEHFLRVAQVAPNSKIRPTAEYDAAASLIVLKQWQQVAIVLEGFRTRYPEHKLKQDITKKLAIVYKEDGQYRKAAGEFERIEKENPDDDVLRREALDQAAELYDKVKDQNKALQVYQKMVDYFPKPLEGVMEARQKIANIYRAQKRQSDYISELQRIVQTDANGGSGRSARTKYLAANAALYLAEPKLDEFKKVKLNQPFKTNLAKKKTRMRDAIAAYTKLVDYEVGDVTAAATFYIAEIYYEFNTALLDSERPKNLSPADLEEYEVVIEEQAYPFEEKAIEVHKNNLELLENGIYNKWIDKSISKLAKLLPARYGKTEEKTQIVRSIKPIIVKPKPLNKNEKTEAKIALKKEKVKN